jgi:hypothetical protein
LTIETGEAAKILACRIIRSTRPAIHLQVDPVESDGQQVKVHWDILEKDDGGILQIIYAGPEQAAIKAHAVMEGQPEIVRFDKNTMAENRLPHYFKRFFEAKYAGWAFLILGILGIYVGMMGIIRVKHKPVEAEWYENILNIAAILLNMLWFSVGVYLLLLLKNTNLPFEF